MLLLDFHFIPLTPGPISSFQMARNRAADSSVISQYGSLERIHFSLGYIAENSGWLVGTPLDVPGGGVRVSVRAPLVHVHPKTTVDHSSSLKWTRGGIRSCSFP